MTVKKILVPLQGLILSQPTPAFTFIAVFEAQLNTDVYNNSYHSSGEVKLY